MVSDKPPKPEQTALSALESSGLSALIERAHSMEALDQSLRRNLPEALAKHCRLVVLEPDKLVFHVSNSVWKNKLRLHSQEILAAASALGLHAREIRIKVDPAFKAAED
jgi:hypothetical protein